MHAYKVSTLRQASRNDWEEESEWELPLQDLEPEHALNGARGLLIAVVLAAPIWVVVYLVLR